VAIAGHGAIAGTQADGAGQCIERIHHRRGAALAHRHDVAAPPVALGATDQRLAAAGRPAQLQQGDRGLGPEAK